MKLTRRTFLLMTGAMWISPSWPDARLFVIDETLRARVPVLSSMRVTPLTGDALWLWHAHLSREREIAGLTRPAEAFVFAQLAAETGMRATQEALNAESVLLDAETLKWRILLTQKDSPMHPSTISSWHVHIYFDASSRDAAWQLRSVIEQHFDDALGSGALTLDCFHQRPVGPHPMWSFQLGFGSEQIRTMLEWLTLNHGALDVFLHPNTGDALRDHRDAAVWIGRSRFRAAPAQLRHRRRAHPWRSRPRSASTLERAAPTPESAGSAARRISVRRAPTMSAQ
ncbi:Aromatic ring-cleaving dioxygenase [Candidatus Burkholderia humilis]|nr:Aromatic ring-cleaving dioxygenase [Candidatus Burkholderia humilis]